MECCAHGERAAGDAVNHRYIRLFALAVLVLTTTLIVRAIAGRSLVVAIATLTVTFALFTIGWLLLARPGVAALRSLRSAHPEALVFLVVRDPSIERVLATYFDYRVGKPGGRLSAAFPVAVDPRGITLWRGGEVPEVVAEIAAARMIAIGEDLAADLGGLKSTFVSIAFETVDGPVLLELAPGVEALAGMFPVSDVRAQELADRARSILKLGDLAS